MSGAIKPVYAIIGHEALRKRETLAALLDALREKEGAADPILFDGPSAELVDVLDSVRTYSLLGDRQVVLVDDADSFVSQNRAALERYCGSPSDAGTLILICQTMPASTKIYKAISANGRVVKCDPPKPNEISAWITERARAKYGKRFDRQAAYRLRELIGDSLSQLDSELGKLALFVGDKPIIEAGDVEALVGAHREQNVFAVIDAMAAGDTRSAMHHWQRVLATDRAAPGRAIAGMAYGIRRLLDCKLRFDAGEPIGGLARRAFMEPDQLERLLSVVSVSQFQRQLGDLMQADLTVKLGLGKLDAAVERFIVTHAKRRVAV